MSHQTIPARTDWKCDGCWQVASVGEKMPAPERWARVTKDRHWDVAADVDHWDLCPGCADAFERVMAKAFSKKKP